jgi:phosphate:Na+ symporter
MRSLQLESDPFRFTFSYLALSGFGVALLLFAMITLAAEPQVVAESPDWLQLGLGLFGGLALFLAGLQQLSEGMKKAAGHALTTVLGKLTTNRFMGAATGAFVTGVLNSSTVTTLLVVGFISGGMMTLAQSVGVIMGANIGSTVTAQLLAFNLSAYSLGPVAIGFFMLFSAKRDKVKYYGMMIMGIGLVFYGMGLMGSAMTPLRSHEPFLDILKSLENPAAGILAGAVFTAIVQSSAATVGIAIAMASEGLLGLPAGIALALGANIGTAVTTALMGILSSKNTEAVRASVVHVAFNVVGVLLWLPLIWLLVDIAVWISPSSPGMEGTAKAAAEVPRQIANANTFFNVINTLLFIGFTGWFARLAEWLVPERAPRKDVIIEPKFLDEAALAAPSVALQQVRLELGRVGDITVGMLQDIRPAFRERDVKRLKDIERRDDEVDILEVEILHYLGKIRQGSLTEEESLEFQGLMMATDNMESLADVIETDLVTLGHKWVELKTAPSDETRKMLIDFHTTILKTVELTVQAIRDNDQRAAESVLMMKGEIREHSERLLARKAERLSVDDPDYLELVRIEMSYVDQMRRIYTLAKRIAKVVLPEVLAQRD